MDARKHVQHPKVLAGKSKYTPAKKKAKSKAKRAVDVVNAKWATSKQAKKVKVIMPAIFLRDPVSSEGVE